MSNKIENNNEEIEMIKNKMEMMKVKSIQYPKLKFYQRGLLVSLIWENKESVNLMAQLETMQSGITENEEK